MIPNKTYDLGAGWYASFNALGLLSTTLTIRNPDKGQRIDLSHESVVLLREIFATASTDKAA